MKPDFTPEIEARLSKLAGNGRILVSGGSGYLGSVLVEMLVQRGFSVTVIDNLSYSQSTLYNLYHTGKLQFIFGDVTNEKFMSEHLQKNSYDFIIPLAAIVGFPVSEQKPEITWLTNHKAVQTILAHRKKAGVLFPTTNSGYGTTDGVTQCTEESPLTPISTYGKSKAEAEKDILASGNSVCFRLATLFGFSPRMRTDLLVNDFVLKAANDRTIVLFERKFKRNFLHVRDAARGFLWAIANWDAMKGNVYNLGHPDYNISKEELCALIKKQVPALNIFNSEIGQDPDKRNYIVSNRKVLDTGFAFNHTLDEGITELLQGYRAFKDFRFRNY